MGKPKHSISKQTTQKKKKTSSFLGQLFFSRISKTLAWTLDPLGQVCVANVVGSVGKSRFQFQPA